MNDLFDYESREGNEYNECKLKRSYGKFKRDDMFVKIKIEDGVSVELHTPSEKYISVIEDPTFQTFIFYP